MNHSLPDCPPFREMMAFYYPTEVEVAMHEQTLRACHSHAVFLIDAFADEVLPCPMKIWSFTYTKKHWVILCDKLGELYPCAEPNEEDRIIIHDYIAHRGHRRYTREGGDN